MITILLSLLKIILGSSLFILFLGYLTMSINTLSVFYKSMVEVRRLGEVSIFKDALVIKFIFRILATALFLMLTLVSLSALSYGMVELSDMVLSLFK